MQDKFTLNGHSEPTNGTNFSNPPFPPFENYPQEQPVPPLPESPSDYQQSHFPFERGSEQQVRPTSQRIQTSEQAEALIKQQFLLGDIPPLDTWIFWQGVPFIIADTQNSIQGRVKAHKSRLAETLVACALGDPSRDYCGFTRAAGKDFHILYFDTERSIRKQIERMIYIFRATGSRYSKAGFPLDFVPLRPEPKENRLRKFEDRIEATREKLSNDTALLVIADVFTDFMINGLLDPVEAAHFTERQNTLLGIGNTAILNLIHDNETGERKAGGRGHGGNNLAQKGTSGLMIEKDKQAGCLIISPAYFRESAEPPQMYAAVDPETSLLKTVCPESRERAKESTTAERMQIVFSAMFSAGVQERKLGEVVEEMKAVFRGGGDKAHSATLKETTGSERLYRDADGKEFRVRLEKRTGKGNPVYLVREQATATAISALEMPF